MPATSALRALAAVVATLTLLALWAPSAHAIGAGSPPANTVLPAVTGTAEVGQTLGCTSGTWTNSPASYAYRWNRDGIAVTLDAPTGAYLLSDADSGKQISCTVTATNADGSAAATSGAVAAAPRSGQAPVVTPPGTNPPALPKAADVIELPSAKRCASRRSFRIRLRKPAGVTLASAAVFVNGKRMKVVKGERLTAPVNLRGLPAGKVAAKIVVTTTDGRKLTHSRKYRTCAAKRGGKRKHRL